MSVKKVKCDETRKMENVANVKATALKYPQFVVIVEAYQNQRYGIIISIPETVQVPEKRLFSKKMITITRNACVARIDIDLFRLENKGTIIPEEMENTELMKLINDLSKGWQTAVESCREILIQIVI